MKIALVVPPSQIQNLYPPLGLCYIAALSQKEGHGCKIFDFSLKSNGSKADAVSVSRFSPDLIGLSVMSNNYLYGLELARSLKSLTKAPVIMGGPHASIFPEEILKEDCVDFVVRGEGEETFKEFLKCYQAGESSQNVAGFSYKINRSIFHNPPRPFIENLDKLPFPERRLSGRYLIRSIKNKPMATLVTSRGCPFSCTFCYKDLFGSKYRYRSAENILEEINQLLGEWNISSFYFVDDLFNLKRERTERLCNMILERKYNIDWQCLCRTDTVDSDLLKLMKKAGCEKIHYGIESGDEEMLKNVKKRINLDEAKKAIRWTKKAGIAVKGYFMIGLPGDTEETIRKTLNFAEKLPFDEVMFSLTTPFPGTEIWNNLTRKISTQDFSKMFYYNFYQNIKPNFNLSKIADNKLSYFFKKANEIALKKKYGKFLGFLISIAVNLKVGNMLMKRMYGLYQVLVSRR